MRIPYVIVLVMAAYTRTHRKVLYLCTHPIFLCIPQCANQALYFAHYRFTFLTVQLERCILHRID